MDEDEAPIRTPEVTSWRQWAAPRRLSTRTPGAKVSRSDLRDADMAARKEWVSRRRTELDGDRDALFGVIAILVVLVAMFLLVQAIS